MKENNFVSFVIYIRNCEEEISPFLNQIYDQIEANFKHFEFIFVNDASEDNSEPIIKKFFESKKSNNSAVIIKMSSFHGKELSMNAAIDKAIGDYVFQFDRIGIDFPIELLMKSYQECIYGKDIISVVPKKNDGFLAKIFYYIYNKASKNNNTIISREAFCVVSRRAINRVNSMVKSVPYRKAMYAQCGLPMGRIEYSSRQKIKEKHSKLSFNNRVSIANDTLIIFTDIVSKITIYVSMIFLIFSLLVGIYVCVVYFGRIKPVEGWSPMMGFLSVAFFGLFFILSIIIKYLSLILNLIFIKETYLIESVEKI